MHRLSHLQLLKALTNPFFALVVFVRGNPSSLTDVEANAGITLDSSSVAPATSPEDARPPKWAGLGDSIGRGRDRPRIPYCFRAETSITCPT
ncbi:hypothetical protein M413DRAFT_246191 [Hebeloma cylindrosporum]|uniref:Uncharacterized protein n=1 Tax=Hebeloma cylindrosporum TaxID=76867 RepID=A0A0C2YBN3_HEBCY|nr:hypothetical protein M413DRAFT_246191 [Hebeloma cylindrosporum h7]